MSPHVTWLLLAVLFGGRSLILSTTATWEVEEEEEWSMQQGYSESETSRRVLAGGIGTHLVYNPALFGGKAGCGQSPHTAYISCLPKPSHARKRGCQPIYGCKGVVPSQSSTFIVY